MAGLLQARFDRRFIGWATVMSAGARRTRLADEGWDVLAAGVGLAPQGDREGALAAYRESLGIARELSSKDQSNTGWRRLIGVGDATNGGVGTSR